MPIIDDASLAGLKAQLDSAHQWPCLFMFKFIVPQAEASRLLALLEPERHTARASRGGKYVALTMEMEMRCSDEVCMLYQKASQVEGVIAL
ncbi:DUF493 family protein [Megalodesulfovibrio paquesii]